jgi:hypothetical protein
MPVLIWQETNEGPRGSVETDWETLFTPEELREEAEALDRRLDDVLDSAVCESRILASGIAPEFARAWAIGRAIRESGILQSAALANEKRESLWLAVARKCRLGIRSDGSAAPEWAELRPSTAREPRREGRRLDYFEMCLWLADQEFGDAAMTFGGSIRNTWQMLERPTLRPLAVRDAVKAWLWDMGDDEKARATSTTVFPELMKALRSRWPDRGPGSAKRPLHYTPAELMSEASRVLDHALEEALDD